jgi:hypothetical protein
LSSLIACLYSFSPSISTRAFNVFVATVSAASSHQVCGKGYLAVFGRFFARLERLGDLPSVSGSKMCVKKAAEPRRIHGFPENALVHVQLE